MNENGLLLVLGLIGFAGMIYIPIIVLLVKANNTVARISASNYRETDRDRRDLHALLMRMIEKNNVNPVHAMQVHANERLEQARLETSLQREEMRPIPPREPGPQDGGPTDDVTLAMI